MNRALHLHSHWLEIHDSSKGSLDEARIGERVLAQYMEALVGMREKIAASLTTYDLHAMGTGMTILWLVGVLSWISNVNA